MIRAIIFDLDGVLVDAVEWHYLALNRSLALFGYPIGREEHHAVYNGLPTSLKLDLLSQKRGFPKGLHRFAAEMKQRYTREIIASDFRPDEAKRDMLRKLKERGYKLAVASNSIRETVDLFLDKLGAREYFDVILSQEDVHRPKPDPAIYVRAVEMLGIPAEECLVVEDAIPGIQAARQVTSHVAVVSGPCEVTYDFVVGQAEKRIAARQRGTSRTLEILVPMAGQGQRFALAGYEKPKPLIPIFGKAMIGWVIDNIRPAHPDYHFTFLCNERHLADYAMADMLESLAPGCTVMPVPSTTEGAACTALLAASRLDPDRPLLMANSDQWVEVPIDDFLHAAARTECDGLILTFPATDDKWSYARTDTSGLVVEVAEKRPISPHATSGIYYFRRAGDFTAGAEEMIRKDTRVRGEFYVCPVYNELVKAGKDIRIFEIAAEAMHGLGTPVDLEAFIRWHLALASGQKCTRTNA